MAADPATRATSPREAGAALETARRVITREAIDAYRQASGDHNRIHYDDEFAAATRFGGVIAHGMLTLALVSELMAKTYGEDWLDTGSLRVRFRGAAYPGDVLEASGHVARCEMVPNGLLVTCNVTVRNADNGANIITGSASVTVARSVGGERAE